MLTRVTGLREIPFGAKVDGAIRESERYYVRYGFATREIPREEGGDVIGETHLETPLRAGRTLLDLLRRTGLPVWSADRPTVLVWVVLERERALNPGARGPRPSHGRARHVISSGSVGALQEVALAMHREARRRGIVLTVPLMDLEDRGLGGHGPLGTVLVGHHACTSRRYACDLMLLGRVAANPGGGWWSHWELKSQSGETGTRRRRLSHEGSSPAAVAGEAVHRVADALARRFAVRGGDLDTIALTVRGAQTVRGYAAVLAYLQSREYIDRVDVSAVEPRALHLKLHSRSARDQLVELLLMGGYLSESRSASPTPSLAGPGLELVWMGDR